MAFLVSPLIESRSLFEIILQIKKPFRLLFRLQCEYLLLDHYDVY